MAHGLASLNLSSIRPARERNAFSLIKWYFDCTTADGRTAIGYCASMRWRRLSLTWQAVSVWEHGELSFERSLLAAGPLPARAGHRISWSAPRLGLQFDAEQIGEPVVLRLFEDAGRSLEWRCEAPSALVTLDLEGRPHLHGHGYVEQIHMTIPPWRLPIRELRWGRWIDHDAAHSLVWIDWRGSHPGTWLIVDGVLTTRADVRDACVVAGLAVLTLECPATLSSGSLADILGRFDALRAMLPGPLMALQQVRWQSHGTWRRHGFRSLIGTAIHERVIFDAPHQNVRRS